MKKQESDWPSGLGERPAGSLTHAELRDRAETYRQMAASATTAGVMTALLRLAERCDALAERKVLDG